MGLKERIQELCKQKGFSMKSVFAAIKLISVDLACLDSDLILLAFQSPAYR